MSLVCVKVRVHIFMDTWDFCLSLDIFVKICVGKKTNKKKDEKKSVFFFVHFFGGLIIYVSKFE